VALNGAGRAPDPKQVEIFLFTCFQHHQYMCRAYQQKPDEERKPMIMNVECMESSPSPLWKLVDTNRFLIPLSLLQRSHFSTSTSPILPLLRCLGIANAMRLVSALVSERRIILVSSSPTRLAACCRSALAILSQGLLNWQHFLIPVLPPHLGQYLQAPFPYLIGVLSTSVDLSKVQEMGEVLMINLDRNELETRNIVTQLISSRIPDLFGMRSDTESINSASEALGQDLIEVIKSDKKTIFGEVSFAGETAAKAAKAVKSAFGRLRQHGRKFLNGPGEESIGGGQEEPQERSLHAVTEDEIYTEGCHNETGEEEVRVAFCTFFLCLYGDLKWYLAPPSAPGETPRLDRDLFLQQKRQLGDGEGSPIFPLLQNMCQSQMFEQFVKARIEEIRTRTVITKDSPLFLVCANYHRQHNIDFSVINVRRVTQQVAQANPSRLISQANANARVMAMTLTSNKGYEGDHAQAVAQLVEFCRETSVLMDVMSVMWMRLNDAKGAQWRHALLALQVIRNLLYHGPLAAIPEATDGLDKIRQLKGYKDNMRAQICQSIQLVATEVYNLIVDRTKLFEIRRFCVNRRREIRERLYPNYQPDRNLSLSLSFKALHPYLHPQNKRQAPPANIPFQPMVTSQSAQAYPSPQHQQMPPQATSQSQNQALPRGMPPQQQQRLPGQGAVQNASRAPPQQQTFVDLLDIGSSQPQPQLHDVFGAMQLGSTPTRPPQQPTIVQVPPQVPGSQIPIQPTIAQIPPQQPYHGNPPFGSPPPQMNPLGTPQPPPQFGQPYQQPGQGGHAPPGYPPPMGFASPAQGPPPGQMYPGQVAPGAPQGYAVNPLQASPNLFTAPPQQYQQAPPQPQRPPVSQFDPFA
jgi:hypothetical protein